MADNFKQHFEIIYNKFKLKAEQGGQNSSRLALARYLGVSHGKMQAWEKGQWPAAQDCANIERLLGFNLRWLVTGDGPIEGDAPLTPKVICDAPKPVPMLGLASCGVEGWNQVMPIAVSASPPVMGDQMVAIIAAGDSMVPAGITSGQICYCDPTQKPLEGDAVYIARRDGLATIKLYLGAAERAGWIKFQGWLSPDSQQRRREFFLEIPSDEIVSLAPVLYVRRRL